MRNFLLVFSIVALLCAASPWYWLGIPLAMIAVILQLRARRLAVADAQSPKPFTPGLVCAAVALGLGLLVFATHAIGGAAVRRELEKAAKDPKISTDFDEAVQRLLLSHSPDASTADSGT